MFESRPNSVGRLPSILFSRSLIISRDVILLMAEAGMLPVSRLCDTKKLASLLKLENVFGRLPVSLLLDKSKEKSFVKAPIWAGMDPNIELLLTMSSSRLEQLPSSSGRLPVRAFSNNRIFSSCKRLPSSFAQCLYR